MNDSPWFPMYAADFLAATQSWESDAVGVYFRLLLHQWVNGQIPIEDTRELCRAAGVFPDELDRYQWIIDSKFPKGKNQRLEEERKKRNERRKNGKKGGRPPSSPPVAKPIDNQTHNHLGNQKPPQGETKSEAKSKGSQSQSHSQLQPPSQPPPTAAATRANRIEEHVEILLRAAGINRTVATLDRDQLEDFRTRPLMHNRATVDEIAQRLPEHIANRSTERKYSVRFLLDDLSDLADGAVFAKPKPNGSGAKTFAERDSERTGRPKETITPRKL